ncbi:flagellar biosynthetic protein FliR [Loktanella fryxellensis]|uniref:Flagellar biosynthetic protein FliR n=1 Tax=Loktanella fryxellensis TaxID=245187 RepID=A0A1H7ZQ90_9RHOB|nr:flagellar biosynthetic protein FliR [Loktanella fryxellensis]SEM60451.1 flagellar biosynthetic protein FliR [Loktanella fryxellensis]
MIDTIGLLTSRSQEALWLGLIVFLRVGATLALVPLFGEQVIPMRVRIAISLAFTLIVAPAAIPAGFAMPTSFRGAIGLTGPEVLAGIFFGLLLRFMIFALQIAGAIIAQSTSLSQLFGGTAGADPQAAVGQILTVTALALVALTGLHTTFAAYMLQTYAMVPVGAPISAALVAEIGVRSVAQTFVLGFTLAVPFVVASLLYNVMLGIMNRAMPQLMVSFVGAPAIAGGGLVLLWVCAPILLPIWLNAFAATLALPGGQMP